MALQSIMRASHAFSQVPEAEIQRSSFDRSHGFKTTMDSSWLVPVLVDEALPGDTFNVRMTAFARLSTPVKPVMDNLKLTSFFFAVPYRLVWTNWVKMNGEQVNPGDSTSYTMPQMTVPGGGGYAIGSLSDYFGIPTGIANVKTHSLFHRAYNLIYNTWFRDENLQNSVTVDTGDGPDSPANYVLRRRGKRHDYFTSCLPWTQKGTAVTIPLGTSANVTGTSANPAVSNIQGLWYIDAGSGQQAMAAGFPKTTFPGGGLTNTSSFKVTVANTPNIPGADQTVNVFTSVPGTTGTVTGTADLSTATAATINALRQAFQIQRMYERDARGGTRYTEVIKAHFGVTSPDARLQRPEYLGGGVTPITIHPVAQTSVSGATAQGNLAGFGTAEAHGHGFTKSFTEHCLILGLVCVDADLTYQQGLDRMFSRLTRFDHYWPALSHLGEQAVLNQEIYCQGDSGGANHDGAAFGYQERYGEYRYKPSRITGLFRSTAAGTVDIWHLSEKFTSLPTLSDSFIQSSADTVVDRVIAVPSEPQFYFDSFFQMKCARPMPLYGVPGQMDHF